eukprot:m.674990 g.674990  ORF g.674990 m.674990 type:complete len:289 (-) comp22784_c0_seq24:820-1686(-)
MHAFLRICAQLCLSLLPASRYEHTDGAAHSSSTHGTTTHDCVLEALPEPRIMHHVQHKRLEMFSRCTDEGFPTGLPPLLGPMELFVATRDALAQHTLQCHTSRHRIQQQYLFHSMPTSIEPWKRRTHHQDSHGSTPSRSAGNGTTREHERLVGMVQDFKMTVLDVEQALQTASVAARICMVDVTEATAPNGSSSHNAISLPDMLGMSDESTAQLELSAFSASLATLSEPTAPLARHMRTLRNATDQTMRVLDLADTCLRQIHARANIVANGVVKWLTNWQEHSPRVLF